MLMAERWRISRLPKNFGERGPVADARRHDWGIMGRVLDSQTRLPIAGATISVASPSGSARTRAHASGAYALLSPAPETYVLTVDIAGCQTALRRRRPSRPIRLKRFR